MGRQHLTASKVLTILAAAALLFVVLFPYTPTPIALSISKILLTVFALSTTCVLFSLILVFAANVSFFRENFSPRFYTFPILDLICLQRR
jgi:hypothetical protein